MSQPKSEREPGPRVYVGLDSGVVPVTLAVHDPRIGSDPRYCPECLLKRSVETQLEPYFGASKRAKRRGTFSKASPVSPSRELS